MSSYNAPGPYLPIYILNKTVKMKATFLFFCYIAVSKLLLLLCNNETYVTQHVHTPTTCSSHFITFLALIECLTLPHAILPCI